MGVDLRQASNMPDSIHCRDPGTAGGVSEMERQGLPALCDYCEVGMDTCTSHLRACSGRTAVLGVPSCLLSFFHHHHPNTQPTARAPRPLGRGRGGGQGAGAPHHPHGAARGHARRAQGAVKDGQVVAIAPLFYQPTPAPTPLNRRTGCRGRCPLRPRGRSARRSAGSSTSARPKTRQTTPRCVRWCAAIRVAFGSAWI